MGAIYKKEMLGFLTNMTGAVIGAVMLLVFGLMFRYYNLLNGVLTLHYAVSSSTLVFYIVVPVLSMRCFAAERRQKTDQLLLTAPVSLKEIVAAKYLSQVTLLLLPTLVMCVYPLIMLRFGPETLLWDYTVIGAFFLMGCAYLSVGMFISACTENGLIAAVLSILFVFATQMLSSLYTMISSSALTSVLFLMILALLAGIIVYVMTAYFTPALFTAAVLGAACLAAFLLRRDLFGGRTESLLRVLDFSTHFSDFAGGVVSLTNVMFFVSYIILGNVFTVLALDKRRWS